MNTKTKQWMLIITTAISTGGAAAAVASHGGCSLGWAIVAGLVAAASAVGHNLADAPADKPN